MQRTPDGPEEAVVQWLGGWAGVLEGGLELLLQHPGFAVAILAVVVYLVAAHKGKKRK